MKSSFSFIKENTEEFFKKWDRSLFLTLLISFFLSIVVFVANFFLNKVIEWNDIPYVSYNNLGIFLQKPWALLGFILIFLFFIFSAYMQFNFLIRGISQIDSDTFQVKRIVRDTLMSTRKQFGPTIIFLILYFIFVIPFAGTIFKTKLLDKVVVPDFILDYLAENFLFAVLILFLSFGVLYVALRFVFVLPLMIMNNLNFRDSLKKSLQITKGRMWFYIWRIILVSLVSSAVTFIFYGLAYMLQVQADKLRSPYSLIFGVVNLSLVQLVSIFMLLWANFILVRLLLSNPEVEKDALAGQKVLQTKPARWLTIAFIFTTVTYYGVGNALYLTTAVENLPANISHRGVDDGNGVQNTIPAMADTIKKAHPDYIEMDIQETKDHKFVVMHDENLNVLAGVNRSPQDLTLEELTSLKVRENGKEASIPSFDEYLKFANGNGQKLLVEIKTTKRDSANLLENFIKLYEKDIVENKHKVQSLDYKIVKGLKDKSKMNTYFIMPYNLVFPNTEANGYTMELTTLNQDFINQAHEREKGVYAWTVNDKAAMEKMFYENVDGIITDNSSQLKDTMESFKDNPTFAQRLWDYITNETYSNSIEN